MKHRDLIGIAILVAVIVIAFLSFANDSPLRMARITMSQLGGAAYNVPVLPDLLQLDQRHRRGVRERE